MVKAHSSSEDLQFSDYRKMHLSFMKILTHLGMTLLLVRLFKINSREIFLLENVCPPMKGIFGKYLLIL